MNARQRARMGLNLARWRGPRGLRLQVLRRDGWLCQFGLLGCTGRATTVHLAPILGGDHRKATLDTCWSACASCHGKVDGPRSRGRFFRTGRAIPARSPIRPAGSETVSDGATANRFLTAPGRKGKP